MRELAPGSAGIREAINAVNQLIRGRSNAAFQVTLAAGATTTTFSNANINADSKPVLFPTTANAAAAMATTYVTVPAAGTIIINHANAASTDRTFNLLIIGG
mgnify:FL=1|jgi:hypothetical protein